MDLSRVPSKLASVTLDGWDGTSWTTSVATVTLEVYSRFITERTFGIVKRIFLSADQIPPQYVVTRTPDGTTYLMSAESRDIKNGATHSYSYLSVITNGMASIVSFTTTPSASGMGSNSVEVVADPTYCYAERISVSKASVVDGVSMTRTKIMLPSTSVVTTSDEVEIDGVRFTIDEVNYELELLQLICKEQ